MRYLILAMLCLISLVSYSQEMYDTNRKVKCGDVKLLIESLTGEEYNEQPIWIGNTDDSNTKTVVMVNNKTLTWTIIQYDGKVGCVLNIGEGFKSKINKSN